MLLPDDQIKTLLTQAGIAPAAIAELETFSRNARVPLQEAVIQKDTLTDDKLGQLIANQLKVPFVALSKENIPDGISQIVPERLARKFKVAAFSRGADGIKLAMTDPTNVALIEMIIRKTRQKIIPYLGTERDIENTFQLYRKNMQQTFNEMLRDQVGGDATALDHVPIARLVDLLITYASRDKASDIHIEPEEKDFLVRFRIDGILHDVLFLNKNLHERILSRIKVLSRLRTDEHLSAQDGKMRLRIDDEDLDLRVSIIPIADGEKAVLRLLSSHFRQFSLLDLGMREKDLKIVNSSINKSYGMILSTGPTGSGKTTSIYALLKILNTREKNLTTIEDPVEYRISGVNQIQVNPKTNLTFANGLRSILRQDPNVIFVGEIRDSETAGIAVNAALTGHLVVSTLHTNDAATALPRLVDMKVEPFLVASTVNVIIAQRLVRKICESCKVQTVVSRRDVQKNISEVILAKHFKADQDILAYSGNGCKVCHFTGYTGRIGVFEVLEMTEKIRRMVSEKNDSDAIAREAASEGMTSMLEDGLDKVAHGETTIEEVLRVTKTESA